MTIISMTSKGRIVIPSRIRKRFNIKKGTKLCVIEKHSKIVLKLLTNDYFEKVAGILNTKGKLTQALLKERAEES